jgi:two-component system, NarL family, nitrate/nitrite response regulator NarL
MSGDLVMAWNTPVTCVDGQIRQGDDRRTSDSVRILIVHANEVMRAGLATMLEMLPVRTEALLCEDVRSATALAENDDLDIIILSVSTSGKVSLKDAEAKALAARASAVGTKILILLSSADDEKVFENVAEPCDGILVEQGITSAAIGEALMRLQSGDMPIPTALVRELLSEVRSLRDQDESGFAKGSHLTPREFETLKLLVQGLRNKQIARRLGISEHGVKRHVANILAKLNCPNRTMAAALAIREGLVDIS